MFNEVNKYCPSAYWYFVLSVLVHVLIIIGNILLGTFTWMSAVWFGVVVLMISFWAYIINLLCLYKHKYVAMGISAFTMLSIIPSIILAFFSDVSLILHPKIKNLAQPTVTKQNFTKPHLDM
jgi:O-antigen ligase